MGQTYKTEDLDALRLSVRKSVLKCFNRMRKHDDTADPSSMASLAIGCVIADMTLMLAQLAQAREDE